MANPNPEQIPVELEKLFREAEQRIMEDIVYRIRVNGFPGATGNWEISRLQQLGESEQTVRTILGDLLHASEEEINQIFSDDVYAAYYGMAPAYSLIGMTQIPYNENVPLQQLVEAVKRQTDDAIANITNTTGFVRQLPGTGGTSFESMSEFYRHTLDSAMIDLTTGAMSYDQVLNRAINTMTTSGVRSVSYESGRSMRIDAAARMCVHTGFRQVMSHINEQTAKDIGTDYYEVPWHAGARPTHQAWQGKVYSHDDLVQMCGLGEATGLCGINCYHDYYPFIPGVSVRTYTDEWLEEQNQRENTKKEYAGKEYTTYEALQEQRKQERVMRKTRESIDLLKEGDADKKTITNMQAKYKGQMSAYKDFSKKMELPEQLDRVFQDQRGNVLRNKAKKSDQDGGTPPAAPTPKAPKPPTPPTPPKAPTTPKATDPSISPQTREEIVKYSDGHYAPISRYSQYLQTGELSRYGSNNIKNYHFTDAEISATKEIINVINGADVRSDYPLYRIENAAKHDPNIKVGETIKMGVRSTTRMTDFYEKVTSGEVKGLVSYIGGEQRSDMIYYTFASHKSLDISGVSAYPKQLEEFVYGSYRVTKVERVVLGHKDQWVDTRIPMREFLDQKRVKYEIYEKDGVERVKYRYMMENIDITKAEFDSRKELYMERKMAPVYGPTFVEVEYVGE